MFVTHCHICHTSFWASVWLSVEVVYVLVFVAVWISKGKNEYIDYSLSDLTKEVNVCVLCRHETLVIVWLHPVTCFGQM